jgi:hypothetical protein
MRQWGFIENARDPIDRSSTDTQILERDADEVATRGSVHRGRVVDPDRCNLGRLNPAPLDAEGFDAKSGRLDPVGPVA